MRNFMTSLIHADRREGRIEEGIESECEARGKQGIRSSLLLVPCAILLNCKSVRMFFITGVILYRENI